ncbi:hypothetical protein [Leclercia sp.]|uniref:hypothetical protein n=1 Tax=Leclercia sp. TaxID=1898428 RepID=UPI0028AF690E|nr:hypothetical protein [Leclercia sp.]
MFGRLQSVTTEMINGGIGKAIDNVGYASMGTGIGLNAASDSSSLTMLGALMPHTWPEWAALFSCLGAISFIIKNILEAWFKIRERKNAGTDK